MWRDTGRSFKFFGLDGRSVPFILLVGADITSSKLWIIALLAVVIFSSLQYFGYTPPNAFRKLRSFMIGDRRLGIHWWRRNK